MLVGTDDLQRITSRAVDMKTLDTEAVALESVEVLQVLCEIDASEECALFPPALHPSLPPLVNWQLWKVGESPWGSFSLATTRLECRSGLRPRGLLLGAFIDNELAAAALAERWGYGLRIGAVALERRYDEVRGSVDSDGERILEIGLRDPCPLGSTDVQYVASVHPTITPSGLRLLQVDPDYALERAERGTPIVDNFDSTAWGDERVQPVYPVSASIALGRVTLPKLRFMCQPDVLAFTWTESIS